MVPYAYNAAMSMSASTFAVSNLISSKLLHNLGGECYRYLVIYKNSLVVCSWSRYGEYRATVQ